LLTRSLPFFIRWWFTLSCLEFLYCRTNLVSQLLFHQAKEATISHYWFFHFLIHCWFPYFPVNSSMDIQDYITETRWVFFFDEWALALIFHLLIQVLVLLLVLWSQTAATFLSQSWFLFNFKLVLLFFFSCQLLNMLAYSRWTLMLHCKLPIHSRL
jgi:hypothetical protein